MFVEKRAFGKSIKYYLVHSYREKNQVRKIRKYLGQNLGKAELASVTDQAKKHILELLEELNTEVFLFTLTSKQVEALNRYNSKIRIHHLDAKEWEKFTENFVYSTNAIEGSNVQPDEVKELLRAKKPNNPEEFETKGVARAFMYIRSAKEDLSLELVKKLHKFCFKETKPFAGQFRNVDVVIKNSKGEIIHAGVQKEQLKYALNDLISWYIKNKTKFKPLVMAAIIHNQFEHIHPFQDGNGRVGRLLLNYILLKNTYPPINIALEDRQEYYLTLQEYSSNDSLKPTLQFLVKQYKKTLRKVSTKNKR